MTRNEVIEILGDIDDLIVARLIDTGADASTLTETLDSMQHEVEFGEPIHMRHTAEADRVREILSELMDDILAMEDLRALDQATD